MLQKASGFKSSPCPITIDFTPASLLPQTRNLLFGETSRVVVVAFQVVAL